MSEQDLRKQKIQAQLDEWRAEIDRLKARARGASADAQLAMDEQITTLQRKIDDGKTALAALAEKGEEAWASFKRTAGDLWDETKAAYEEGVSGSEPKT